MSKVIGAEGKSALAAVSHELKTPLHSILAVSHVLLSEVDGPLTAEQRRQMGMIVDNGEKLKLIIERLFADGKILGE